MQVIRIGLLIIFIGASVLTLIGLLGWLILMLSHHHPEKMRRLTLISGW
ncbi:hypothetical protein [Lacticaseibacillus rhamnosus]|nr:hypothetical protein [Lacticaseibacillus rhamnosus]